MNKKSLYILIMVISLLSYGWLFFIISGKPTHGSLFTVCFFKSVTSVPCPACGTTRSVVTLLEGNMNNAIMINPFGILAIVLLITLPPWVMYDLIKRRESFYRFYKRAELFVQQKYVASALIMVVIANWVWNIMKEI